VSNLLWADHSEIGYKMIGSVPIRRGNCPDVVKPGWTAEFEWEDYVPHQELPEIRNPDCEYLVTANNRVTPDDYPHHITSDWLDGYRARRIEELILAREQHDLAGFERMQVDVRSAPGLEVARRLARLSPASQREATAIERLRSWNGDMGTESIAATIYQAFTLRLARDFLRAAVRDRDLSERWLDRAVNGFTAHVTSPWRWQSRLMALWEEADDELIGRPWGELVMDALRGALDDLEERYGADPAGWRWGDAHEMEFPHALGEANWLFSFLLNRSLRVGGAQETVSQIAYDPGDPFTAVWAPSWRMVADPNSPDASRWQLFTGNSGHPGSEHYDDLQERWASGLTQPMIGEGPWRELVLEPLGGN
jgi:penicillin amidase